MKVCSVCKRELPLDAFLTITKRGNRDSKPGYSWTGQSSECRECRKEQRRKWRRRKAEEAGRPFAPRGDRAAYEAAMRDARERRKLDRRVAWAMCLAFWRIYAYGAHERKAKQFKRSVIRQRERRHTDPTYRDVLKARKIRRKRAMDGAQVDVVSLLRVAERDNWICYLCHRAVMRGATIVREQWSMEHVIPLSKGGRHTYDNVRLAHRGCNSSKNNKMPTADATVGV